MSATLMRRLLDVLPSDPQLVAEVLSHEADGTSVLALPGGGQLVARGTSVAVGSYAFVRGGLIEGEAPALPFDVIEI